MFHIFDAVCFSLDPYDSAPQLNAILMSHFQSFILSEKGKALSSGLDKEMSSGTLAVPVFLIERLIKQRLQVQTTFACSDIPHTIICLVKKQIERCSTLDEHQVKLVFLPLQFILCLTEVCDW